MLLVVGVAFAFNANADSGKWVLQLWDHTGQICGTYDLTIQPNVTFTEDQVVVTTDVADVFYYSPFPLNSLSQGVYMVNVNGKTYKIVKK